MASRVSRPSSGVNSYAARSFFIAARNALLIFLALWAGLTVTLYSWKTAIAPHAQRAQVACAPLVNVHRAFHRSWFVSAHADWSAVRAFDKWSSDLAYRCNLSESRQ